MILPTAHPHRSTGPRNWHPRCVRTAMPSRQVASLLAILAAHSITAGTSASGQEPVRVSGAVTCQECRITLDTVVTLGGLDGPGVEAIGQMSSVAVDRRGWILVWNAGGAEITVFDMTGGFIRTVGGRGEGPGEYSSISRIDTGPRYIHVFEYHQGRTVLDHDFNVIRTDMFPGQVLNTFVTESDEVAFAASVPTSTSTGYRFHLLGESGNTVSFGEGAESTRGATAPQDMFVAAGDSDALWFVAVQRNRVMRWDLAPEPTLAKVFDRTVEEFDRHDDPSSWPGAANGGAMLDEDGLWIVWTTPDPDAPPMGLGQRVPQGPWRELYDGWIDLVDPSAGTTLARYHDDEFLTGFAAGSRYVVTYHETDAGVPYIHLLEPKLSRGPGN